MIFGFSWYRWLLMNTGWFKSYAIHFLKHVMFLKGHTQNLKQPIARTCVMQDQNNGSKFQHSSLLIKQISLFYKSSLMIDILQAVCLLTKSCFGIYSLCFHLALYVMPTRPSNACIHSFLFTSVKKFLQWCFKCTNENSEFFQYVSCFCIIVYKESPKLEIWQCSILRPVL